MPAIKTNGLIRQEDLLYIEKILYEVKKEELVARQIFHVNTDFPSWARQVGYKIYDPNGEALLLPSGASPGNIPFVGEKGGTFFQGVYNILTGIRIEWEEMMEAQATAENGKGPAVKIDQLRVIAARRYIAEKENKLVFAGNSDYKIPGLFNFPGTIGGDVAASGTGADATAQRLWVNKTPSQIIDDVAEAKAEVEKNDVFTARVLALPPSARKRIISPYSTQNPMTLYKWFTDEGVYFEKIITTSACSAANNGLGVDAFVVLDNDPTIAEIGMPLDLELGNPIYDIMENQEMVVRERCAGLMCRHPAAIYIGKGI